MIHKTSLNKFIYYQEINSFLTFPPPSWRIFKSEFIIYGDTIIVYEIILSLGNLVRMDFFGEAQKLLDMTSNINPFLHH